MPVPTRSGLPSVPHPRGRGKSNLSAQPSVHFREAARLRAHPNKPVVHIQFVAGRGWKVLSVDAPRVPYGAIPKRDPGRTTFDVALDQYQYIYDPKTGMYFKIPYDPIQGMQNLEQQRRDAVLNPKADPRSPLQQLFEDGGGYFIAASKLVKVATAVTFVVYAVVGAAFILPEALAGGEIAAILARIQQAAGMLALQSLGYAEAFADALVTLACRTVLGRAVVLLSSMTLEEVLHGEWNSEEFRDAVIEGFENVKVPWGQGIDLQGKVFEKWSIRNNPNSGNLPDYYPDIDEWNDVSGIATSDKTLDTQMPGYYSNPAAIRYQMNRYITKLAKDKAYSMPNGSFRIESEEIKSKVLKMGVPWQTTRTQWEQIKQAIDSGQMQGVKVIVVRTR